MRAKHDPEPERPHKDGGSPDRKGPPGRLYPVYIGSYTACFRNYSYIFSPKYILNDDDCTCCRSSSIVFALGWIPCNCIPLLDDRLVYRCRSSSVSCDALDGPVLDGAWTIWKGSESLVAEYHSVPTR